ncbi:MAG TPA: addiction module antidote protein [Terracidiphilus sp.]|jgi:probable addiction module antidote protein|nr:addiction module antidote protein [Terracidiphilus sp.]
MRKLIGATSHDEREMEELRNDRELVVEYARAAVESLNDPDERAGGLTALRSLAEAYGGLGAIAANAGISREALYRSLSPKGNPTLKTLVAVLKPMGLRLSVVAAPVAKPRRAAKKVAPRRKALSKAS